MGTHCLPDRPHSCPCTPGTTLPLGEAAAAGVGVGGGTGQGGTLGKQPEEITCVRRPNPTREEEESCPRECCLDPWTIPFPQLPVTQPGILWRASQSVGEISE